MTRFWIWFLLSFAVFFLAQFTFIAWPLALTVSGVAGSVLFVQKYFGRGA